MEYSLTIRNIETMMLLLIVTLGVALIAGRLRLPYTLVLVICGLIIGFLPILQDVHLEPDIVLFLFLPILLFEGAWSVDVKKLIAEWLPILLLALPGLLIALLLLAVIMHIGIGLSWLLAILLGAIVSPTDPIAALALLRKLGLAERLSTIVEGESLFNDGVGAAVFQVVLILLLPTLGFASFSEAIGHASIVGMLVGSLWLIVGGPLLGLLIGWSVGYFLRFINDHLLETTLTIGVAYGSYILGTLLQTSGLLAVVCAGLVIGSYGRDKSMSQRAQEAAQEVWEFLAYLANSLLFLLLGIQIGESNMLQALPGILCAFLGIVAGRLVIVYTLIPLNDVLARRCKWKHERTWQLPCPRPLSRLWRPLLVLSGLRGALSLALVLSLPTTFAQRDLLAGIVYGVVLITLLGQGLGLRFLLPHWPVEQKS